MSGFRRFASKNKLDGQLFVESNNPYKFDEGPRIVWEGLGEPEPIKDWDPNLPMNPLDIPPEDTMIYSDFWIWGEQGELLMEKHRKRQPQFLNSTWTHAIYASWNASIRAIQEISRRELGGFSGIVDEEGVRHRAYYCKIIIRLEDGTVLMSGQNPIYDDDLRDEEKFLAEHPEISKTAGEVIPFPGGRKQPVEQASQQPPQTQFDPINEALYDFLTDHDTEYDAYLGLGALIKALVSTYPGLEPDILHYLSKQDTPSPNPGA